MSLSEIAKETKKYKDKTTRSTNSLDPIYKINGEIIDVQFKPTPSRAFIPESSLLQTKDIEGAYPGWIPHQITRTEFKNTNVIHDIKGAQADTIKHGITTNRIINPLSPHYKSLDGDNLPPCTVPLLPESIFHQPKLRIPQSPINTLSRAGSESCKLFSPMKTNENFQNTQNEIIQFSNKNNFIDSLSINTINLNNNNKSTGPSPQITGNRYNNNINGNNKNVNDKKAYNEMLSDIAAVRALS